MPRTGSETVAGTLLRSVFAKSPLSLATKTTDDDGSSSPAPDTHKTRRHRSPSFLSHNRSNSQQSNLSFEPDVRPSPPRTKRQRSRSHVERIHPLSLSKLALTTSAEIPASAHPCSFERTNTSQIYGDEQFYGRILHHGDAYTSHIGWRKKFEYLVLTEHYLLRFKTAKKAADKFPWLFPISSQIRQPTASNSFASLSDPSSPLASDFSTDLAGTKSIIPLQHIIAVQAVQEAKTRLTLELIWQASHLSHANTISLSVERIAGRPHWLESLNSIAKDSQSEKRPLSSESPVQTLRPGASIHSSIDFSEEDSEYPVYRRQTHTGDLGYVTPDDLSKEPPTAQSLIISRYKVEILPFSRTLRVPSIASTASTPKAASFGIVSLRQVSISERDDAFDLVFRNPQQPPVSFELASIFSHEIAQQLHTRLELLKPNWSIDPYLFRAPGNLSVKLASVPIVSCPHQDAFGQVLQAHCGAWGLSSSDINYSIDTHGEDSPRFQLLPRLSSNGHFYSALEILAVLRALRYNDYFVTISFANIALDRLAQTHDHFGHENICLKPRMGQSCPIPLAEMQHASLLFQELSAIVMTDRKLRRLDFTNAIQRSPSQHLQESGDDKGSGLVEPLYRLCANQNTNLDWIVLNGIQLSRTDVDFLMAILANRDCHLRAVELSGCHLDFWSLRLLTSELPTQSHTLEVINISDNPGRLSPTISLGSAIANCQSLKIINLSRLVLDPEPAPLLTAEILFSLKLEELRLSRTVLNESTLAVLIQYLESPVSSPLRRLYLDCCGLRSEAVARLFYALSKSPSNGSVHLDISGNNIDTIEPIIPAIRADRRVTSLTWKLLDLEDPEHFQQLVQALAMNTVIKHLDLSELLLDFQLNREILAALKNLFANNRTIEYLDISGNNSRLDNCNFGPQIHSALRGLSHNTTLKALRIHDQGLSMDGASSLAEVLKTNNTLTTLDCENNSIPLAGLSLLVDALRANSTIRYLSSMESDRCNHMQSVEASVIKAARPKEMINHLGISQKEKNNLSPEVVEAVSEVNCAVDAHWQFQQRRLERYLARNQRIAAGEATLLVESDTESQATAATDDDPLNLSPLEKTLSKLSNDGSKESEIFRDGVLV